MNRRSFIGMVSVMAVAALLKGRSLRPYSEITITYGPMEGRVDYLPSGSLYADATRAAMLERIVQSSGTLS